MYSYICTCFFSICFTQMSMFSFHILFLYLLLQNMEDFCLFYALASMIFYSRRCIVCNVFIPDIFEMFYAFLCILCILIQGAMVEQLCLNGSTLYKYICNKIIKIKMIYQHDHLPYQVIICTLPTRSPSLSGDNLYSTNMITFLIR